VEKTLLARDGLTLTARAQAVFCRDGDDVGRPSLWEITVPAEGLEGFLTENSLSLDELTIGVQPDVASSAPWSIRDLPSDPSLNVAVGGNALMDHDQRAYQMTVDKRNPKTYSICLFIVDN
jgi:hypothetical protein